MNFQQVTIDDCNRMYDQLGKAVVINDGRVLGFVQCPGIWAQQIDVGEFGNQVFCHAG
ncbi:hypothetical protein [Diplocloster agilis]|uniref:hypothetical protein n=1 Tax=Diplocloster agilis TaxID=2850323 RepID=UPI0008217D39|nr:hypothetical protein [Suonthocola fibrivorans]MCU6734911.1 hypothetical protein [Suonthocola fibrivorans]SCJ58753.1 Uncharacterised protein [uncultured Clostridium sp.]